MLETGRQKTDKIEDSRRRQPWLGPSPLRRGGWRVRAQTDILYIHNIYKTYVYP